ncbi:hypothetical protein C0431_13955 [bacterium]|nr:hypothetical protein [bacterium]
MRKNHKTVSLVASVLVISIVLVSCVSPARSDFTGRWTAGTESQLEKIPKASAKEFYLVIDGSKSTFWDVPIQIEKETKSEIRFSTDKSLEFLYFSGFGTRSDNKIEFTAEKKDEMLVIRNSRSGLDMYLRKSK